MQKYQTNDEAQQVLTGCVAVVIGLFNLTVLFLMLVYMITHW